MPDELLAELADHPGPMPESLEQWMNMLQAELADEAMPQAVQQSQGLPTE